MLVFLSKHWSIPVKEEHKSLNSITHSKYISDTPQSFLMFDCFLYPHTNMKACQSKKIHIDLKRELQTGVPMGRKWETFF